MAAAGSCWVPVPVTPLLPPPQSGTHGGQEGPPLPMRLRTGMRRRCVSPSRQRLSLEYFSLDRDRLQV